MKKIIGIITVITMLTLTTALVYAGDKDLALDSVDVTLDMENVAPDETLYLNFSNNVVNAKVKEQNMTCFSLVDDKGEAASFTVFMGDDQVDNDVKRIVEIRPDGVWKEGTTYTLTVDGSLSAKNGSTLGEPVTVVFKTTGGSSPVILYGVGGILIVLIGGLFIGRKKFRKA